MDSCFPLCIETSTPVESADALQLALTHFIDSTSKSSILHEDSTIFCIMLLDESRKKALGWTSSAAVITQLVSESLLHLQGTLTIRCTLADSAQTNIYIVFPKGNPHTSYYKIPLLQAAQQICGGADFSAFSRGNECILHFSRPVQLPPLMADCTVRPILPIEMCVLLCSWHGRPLKDVVAELSSNRKSLLTIVQYTLLMNGVDAAVIVVSNTSPLIVSLLCATRDHADLIRNHGAIKLGVLGQLTPTVIHTNKLKDKKVLGKYEHTMDLNHEFNTTSRTAYVFWNADDCPLSANDDITRLDLRIGNEIQKLDIHSDIVIFKSMFLSQEKFKGACLTSLQIRELTSIDYKITFSTAKMMIELDALIIQAKQMQIKPIVVILAGCVNEILINLRLEGIKEVTYIYNIPPLLVNTFPFDSLTSTRILWDDFKELNSIRPSQLTALAQAPVIQNVTNLSEQRSKSIDLEKLSIALHLKNLIAWSAGDARGLLHGERNVEDMKNVCTIRVVSDNKTKVHSLILTGDIIDLAKRSLSLQVVVDTLRSNRRINKLPGWKAQHRESILNSLLFTAEEARLECTALLHTPESRVIVECISMNIKSVKEFQSFLASLIPREDEWDLPLTDGKYFRTQEWSAFLREFSLSSRVKLTTSSGTKITIWGFGGLVDKAKYQLLEKMSSMSNSDTASSRDSIEVRTPLDGNSLSGEGMTEILTFKEKEVGFYYLAFEAAINLFLLREYAVNAVRLDQELSPAAKKNFPPLRVALAGDIEAIKAAKIYIEGFSKNHLKRIFFPMVDALKYKEICEMVDRQRITVALNRSKDKRKTEDLYFSTGFVSIRLTPPMHNKGIRRMTLPADATVIIQSPVESELQLLQFESSYNAVNKISSGYFESTIDISHNPSLAKILAVRHSREEFAKSQGLTGINWIPSSDNNSTGTVKLWANNESDMKPAMEKIILESQTSFNDELIGLEDDHSEPSQSVEIRLPHPSLVFVLKEHQVHIDVESILSEFPSSLAVSRNDDITDPLLFVTVYGPSSDLNSAKMELRTFLEQLLDDLYTVKLKIQKSVVASLTANNSAYLNRIQSMRGVHVILFPDLEDLEDADNHLAIESSLLDFDDLAVSYDAYRTTIVNYLKQSAHLSISMSCAPTDCAVILVSAKTTHEVYNEPFSILEGANTPLAIFRIEIPGIPQEKEWFVRSLIKVYKCANSYSVHKLCMVFSTDSSHNFSAVNVYNLIAAQTAADYFMNNPLQSFRHFVIHFSDLFDYSELKSGDTDMTSCDSSKEDIARQLLLLFIDSSKLSYTVVSDSLRQNLSSFDMHDIIDDSTVTILLRGLKANLDQAKEDIQNAVLSNSAEFKATTVADSNTMNFHNSSVSGKMGQKGYS